MTDASFVIDPIKKIRKIEQTSIKAGRIYNKMCADIALDYYNTINGTNFELVEEYENMGSCTFTNKILPGTLTHCFFKANQNCCINEFFAEISHVAPLYPSVLNCKLVTQECETRVPALQKYPPFVAYSPFQPFKGTADERITHPTYHPERTIATTRDLKTLRVTYLIAKRAIRHYNNINETTYEIATCQIKSMRSCFFSGGWIHICFPAKEYSHPRIELFFAEIKYSRVSMPVVTICRILDSKTKTKVGCENCKLNEVIHPVEGYRAEFLHNMEIVEAERGLCNKVFEEEYLGRVG